MTQEEKQLLLKDLCARLPYEFQCEIGGLRHGPYTFTDDDVADLIAGRMFKPYLRPLSSITEEEKEELREVIHADFLLAKKAVIENNVRLNNSGYNNMDWLNVHHFDYRGLIEKNLALEAPADMYKTK